MLNAILMMTVVSALMGLILGIAGKVFYVQVDERTETVTGMLPGYNCGGCGYPGCSGLAAALVDKELAVISCKPCKAEQKAKIVEYLANTPGPDGTTITVKA
ncbi:MAG: electron transporter RnfB [Erysipelotrichaceae bacterium]|jgi:electron transport complex protein RnfB|nr:electron transporter RnfB [Erysipelotrichaceae bacterium]